MNDYQFCTVWQDALKSTSCKGFMSDWVLSSLFVEDPMEPIDMDLWEELGRIWDAAHMTVADIRTAMGLNRPQFSRHFCVPVRTVENWESRGGCPDYLRLLMIKDAGLLRP